LGQSESPITDDNNAVLPWTGEEDD